MRIARVHLNMPLTPGDEIRLPMSSVQHLAQVLRLRSGDPIVLFNGDGRDFAATLLSCSKRGAVVRVGDGGIAESEPTLSIHLGIGISKGERMDFALQKAVELGVHSMTPLFTARSVVRLDGERLANRERHWRGIVISACEQSGRRRLPVLESAHAFGDWLHHAHGGGVVLDHRSPTALRDMSFPEQQITFLVGPEGGLTQVERSAAQATGFATARLGPRVLRTETAPLAAIAAAQTLWGDLG